MTDKTDLLIAQLAEQNKMLMGMMQQIASSQQQQQQKPPHDFTADREALRKSMDDGVFDKMEAYFKAQNEQMFGSLKTEVDSLRDENAKLKEQLGNTAGQLRNGLIGVDADEEFDKMPVSEGLPFTWGQVRNTATESMDKAAAERYAAALSDWKKLKQGEEPPASSNARGGSSANSGGNTGDAEAFLKSRNEAMIAVANGAMTREEFSKQFGGKAAA